MNKKQKAKYKKTVRQIEAYENKWQRRLAILAGAAIALFILLSLNGCGKFRLDSDVKVEGKVDVEHSINLNDLKSYFTVKCEELQVEDDCYSVIITECTDCMVGDFLTTIGKKNE